MQPTQKTAPLAPVVTPPIQQTPPPASSVAPPTKTAASINYASLHLMNSTAGLLDNAHKDVKPLITLLVVLVVGIVIGGFVWGIIVLTVGVFGYIAKLQADRNSKLWKQFAQDNGWLVGPAPLAQAVVPPTIASRGHSRKMSDVISGVFSGNVFKSYVYTYTVGSGKNSTTHTQTILQVVLQKALPSFLLDSSQTSVIHGMPNNFVHISLEGNFDDSFKLYAPKEATTDVLSVISPDVMQTLIQKNTFQDIQSEGGSIWFMQYGDTRKQEQLPALFVAIEGLMPEFYHRLKSYKATNAAAHTQQTIATNASYGMLTQVPVAKNKFQIVFIIFVLFFMFSVISFIIMAFTGVQ